MSVSAGDRRSLRPPSNARPQGPRPSRQPRSSTVSLLDTQRFSAISRDSTLYSPGPSSPLPPESPKVLSPIESRPETPASTNSYSSLAASPSLSAKPLQKFPTLIAPSIKFEATAVSFKGLPLEAALWTFDSKVLQSIVSRAIRSSAKESFIRLLSLENLDTFIPAEIDRLQSLKTTQQSRYRFNVQRRTMLLQALVSFSATDPTKDQDGGTLVGRLATQLAEITAACDLLAEELVSITDQITQLTKLVDAHWASALAIALRKLNSSYGKRTTELVAAKERVAQLETQLEDAWKEAEKIALEMDELDAGIQSDEEEEEEEEVTEQLDDGTAIINRAEVVSIASSKESPAPVNGVLMSGTIVNIQPVSPVAFSPITLLPETAVVAPQPEPMEEAHPEPQDEDLPPPVPPKDVDDSDKISIRSRRSVKSTKSHRSTRSNTDRVSVISAARIRSQRASVASLRLPRNLRQFEYPPVPDLPKHLSNLSSRPPSSFHPPANFASYRRSFLTLSPTASSDDLLSRSIKRQRTSIDDLDLIMRHVAMDGSFLSRPQSTVDDIHIMPPRTPLAEEIEEVPRTPRFRRSVDDISLVANTRRVAKNNGPSSTIPSIWLMSDAPKTPAERVESLMQEQMPKPPPSSISRFKTFTKRYSKSVPFPRLNIMSPRTHK